MYKHIFVGDLQITLLICLFFIGCVTLVLGISTLITSVWRKDLRSIVQQTAKIAQKGLAEEISGLVGNASTLLTALNDLARTSTGIGVFLTLTGTILMATACLLILKLS